jgi:hypothetical protein
LESLEHAKEFRMHMSLRKLTLFTVNLLLLAFLMPMQNSHAASIGSSPCTQNVTTTATTAVVYDNSNSKCYVIFLKGSNSWTAPSGISSVDLLLIGAGGAGGSGAWGGGGGAGGIVLDTGYTITPGNTYSLAIGDSGTPGNASLTSGSPPSGNQSGNGGDTWFNTNSSLVAIGGGAGASYSWGQASFTAFCAGRSGGSGGGATECTSGVVNAGGSSTQTLPTGADAYYGNTGGSTPNASNYSGGGGGGSGAAGSSVSAADSPGAGGNGTQAFASWISAITSSMAASWQTATTNGYIAAGGGGASHYSAAGGLGGGGKGGINTSSSTINGDNGVANTGSGGGGSSYSGPGYGGYGGSGLLVIRYAAAVSTTVSLGLAGGVKVATYRAPIALTATLTGGNGKVRFYQDGKIIPGCQSITSSGLSATCMWRPASKRYINLSAELVANGAVLGSKSIPITVTIVNRSGTRN